MTKSNLLELVIDNTIDMCANNIRVAGIIAILADNDIVSISKMISKTKINNYMAIEELMNQYDYADDQRAIVFSMLERESAIAAMNVKHYYDDYRGVEV